MAWGDQVDRDGTVRLIIRVMTGHADRPQPMPVVEGCTVAAIAVIAAVASYYHEFELARRNGQPGWVSALLPFSVDGLVVLGGVTLLWAAAQQIRRPARPWLVLAVGIAATIGANLAADLHRAWLPPVVSAWPGVAVAIAGEMLVWLIRTRRQLAAGPVTQPAADCSCPPPPPPPTCLAEALPLARAELKRLGEKCGEQELADLFGVSRHRVRTELSAPVVPVAQSSNGYLPEDPR